MIPYIGDGQKLQNHDTIPFFWKWCRMYAQQTYTIFQNRMAVWLSGWFGVQPNKESQWRMCRVMKKHIIIIIIIVVFYGYDTTKVLCVDGDDDSHYRLVISLVWWWLWLDSIPWTRTMVSSSFSSLSL
jgi:hypothetical protein